jgi:hypothetical protein
MQQDEWAPVVDLIERVVGEDALLPSVVAGVRTMVREIGVLPPADIAGHTRVLLVAATRAIAARRGPTEAELAFVAELGTARAGQGVPVEAVLGAIHVAERAIWSRAREVAAADGVRAELLLDARELYDDWSEAVRARLIAAHRAAEAGRGLPAGHRDAALVRRLLEGGSAAALAAAEAGLPVGDGLWVTVARPQERGRRGHPPALSALLDGLQVTVLTRPPTASPGGGLVGLAGPGDPEELGAVRRLAVAALAAAEAVGRTGVVHVGDVAALAAVQDRADLAAVLLERHQAAWTALGTGAEGVVRGVCAWLQADRDVVAAAGALFVHPNTVRNRVQRFAEVTGIAPHTTFGALDAWWLCSTWLTHHLEDRPASPTPAAGRSGGWPPA